MFVLVDKVARLACGAVANAAEDSQTHTALLSRVNAMHYMVFLMRSRHLSVHREASRACGNLLTNRDAHRDFISEVSEEYALRSILLHSRGRRKGCNISWGEQLETLRYCIAMADIEISRVAGDSSLRIRSSLPSSLRLTSPKPHCYEPRKLAVKCQDGLRSLLLVATSLDDECQYNAAVIYRKLCADRHTHDYVVGRGGLQALLGLVQLRGLGTQRQAAAALRDVCSNKDHKVRNMQRPVDVRCFGNFSLGVFAYCVSSQCTRTGRHLPPESVKVAVRPRQMLAPPCSACAVYSAPPKYKYGAVFLRASRFCNYFTIRSTLNTLPRVRAKLLGC